MLNQDVAFCQNKHWKNLLITNVRCLSPFSWKNQGTSRSSILGEADVNLAEFAEALKPVSIALPLRGSVSGMLLHVWILENVSFTIIVIIEKKTSITLWWESFQQFCSLFCWHCCCLFPNVVLWSNHFRSRHNFSLQKLVSGLLTMQQYIILNKKLLVLSF